MTKCALCGDSVDEEHPSAIRWYNPATFRMAWMHLWCYRNAYDMLEDELPGNVIYDNRQDEYNDFVQK